MMHFWKMHALGNDFVIIDANDSITFDTPFIQKLANRHLGIGFDQLLLLKADNENFNCRIFNADGSEAEQCGNGLRAVAKYIALKKLSASNEFNIQTKAGIFEIKILNEELIKVSLGVPKIHSEALSIDFMDHHIVLRFVDLGNPHCLLSVSSVDTFALEAFNQHLRKEINIGCYEKIDAHTIKLRTYERGAGLTLSCGSNTCAAVVSGIEQGELISPVTVISVLGELKVHWDGANTEVWLTGPATKVFEGSIKN